MAMKNTLTEDVLLEALPKTIKRNISDAENVVVSNIIVLIYLYLNYVYI